MFHYFLPPQLGGGGVRKAKVKGASGVRVDLAWCMGEFPRADTNCCTQHLYWLQCLFMCHLLSFIAPSPLLDALSNKHNQKSRLQLDLCNGTSILQSSLLFCPQQKLLFSSFEKAKMVVLCDSWKDTIQDDETVFSIGQPEPERWWITWPERLSARACAPLTALHYTTHLVRDAWLLCVFVITDVYHVQTYPSSRTVVFHRNHQ